MRWLRPFVEFPWGFEMHMAVVHAQWLSFSHLSRGLILSDPDDFVGDSIVVGADLQCLNVVWSKVPMLYY